MGRNFNMMMKKCCKIVSFISAISLLCSCGNNIGGDGTYSFNKNITDEVKYSSFYGESDIISDNDYKESILINKLEISSLENVTLKPTIAYDTVLGLESLHDQAQREIDKGSSVIAGINCDMFAMETSGPTIAGMPLNTTIIDGVIYNSSSSITNSYRMPVFAVRNDKTPYIGNIFVSGNIKVTNKYNKVDEYETRQFNRNYDMFGIGTFTRKISSDGVVRLCSLDENGNVGIKPENVTFYLISGIDDADNIRAGKVYSGTVEKIVKNTLELEIPEGHIAFSDTLNTMSSVRIGDKIEVEYSLNKINDDYKLADNLNDIQQCVGAYNWIIKDGIVQTKEIYSEQKYPEINYIIVEPTARSAIGIRNDGSIIAAIADQSLNEYGYSTGMTMDEWAEYFTSLGCVNAVNFDGGGSAEMILINKNDNLTTVNYPTDEESRKIATGLVAISSNGKYNGYDKTNITIPILICSASVILSGAIIFSAMKIYKNKRNT